MLSVNKYIPYVKREKKESVTDRQTHVNKDRERQAYAHKMLQIESSPIKAILKSRFKSLPSNLKLM